MRPSFDLDELALFLHQRNIHYLFHANSIETSLSFFKANALLSRAKMDQSALPQSHQTTDDLDKKLGIYNDIFLNMHDAHTRFKRSNAYGPVLFRLKTSAVINYVKSNQGTISITGSNPMYWSVGLTNWLSSIQCLEKLFQCQPSDPDFYRKSTWLNGAATPDVVISMNLGLPLSLVSSVWIDRSANHSGLFQEFKLKADSMWVDAKTRLGIIQERSCALESCKCQSTSSEKLFTFGNWAA